VAEAGLVACGLEELDGVGGGIVDQDLLAADADDHAKLGIKGWASLVGSGRSIFVS
jgi:hypothetical protein